MRFDAMTSELNRFLDRKGAIMKPGGSVDVSSKIKKLLSTPNAEKLVGATDSVTTQLKLF